MSFFFGNSSAGKVVNERTALSTSAVYACVRILSEAVAGLPLHVYEYTNDNGKERIPKHPLYHLLHDEPNPEMTSFVFRETMMSHLLLYGNAYAQIVRDGRGYPVALYPLPPSKVTVDRAEGGELVYTYYSDDTGKQTKLRRPNILHIPGLGYDGIVGYSPIALAKQAIGTAIAVEEYGARFFSNGASPGGVLEFPGTVKDIQRVKESWNAGYQGSDNAHKVALLEEGAKWSAISIPPEQAQFLETRKFTITEIARIYRVPPHMLADLERATFSNVEHLSLEFVKFSVSPWVQRWEQSLFQALVLPSEKKLLTIRFNLDGLLRGDYASRMSGYATARQNGWLSANDIRDLEEMNRIPAEEGGDLYLINGSMTKLADAGLFAGRQNQSQSETEDLQDGKKKNSP
jgi:HK97 family phage portal protein